MPCPYGTWMGDLARAGDATVIRRRHFPRRASGSDPEAQAEERAERKSEAGPPCRIADGALFFQPKRGGTTGDHALVPNPGRARFGFRRLPDTGGEEKDRIR